MDLDLEGFGKTMAIESDVIAMEARATKGLESVEKATDRGLTVRKGSTTYLLEIAQEDDYEGDGGSTWS